MKSTWHQEPFVWLLILFPFSAVIGGIITLFLAINSNDGLVADNYYKQGLEINRILERDKAALKYNLQAILKLDKQFIYLTLNANQLYKAPDRVLLQFNHSTRSGFDKQVMLKHTHDHNYQAVLPEIQAGLFSLQLIADDWRLLKSTSLPINEELHF